MTLYFNQDDIDRLGVAVTQLEIISFQMAGGQGFWQPFASTALVNQELNWVEQTIGGSGIYALVAKP